MFGPNLSEWALKHRALVLYAMVVLMIGGLSAYARLGRAEDPSFTIKTMVVAVQWPGATADETSRLVTDRIERALQQTPSLDNLRSLTRAGDTVIYVTLKDTTPPAEVPRIWDYVREKVGDVKPYLPAGVVGPGFNDEFGDTFGVIYAFTSDGFSQRELRDYVDQARSRMLGVPGVAKAELVGAQDEAVYLAFSPARMAALGLDQKMVLEALQSQNAVAPSGWIAAGGEKVMVRVSGGFQSEDSIRAINLPVGERIVRLEDLAEVRRGYADPPDALFRINGKPAIGLAISMAEGGDILALGEKLDEAVAELKQDLPVGVEARLIANQPEVVDEAVGHFMKSLLEAVAIVLAVSFLSLGGRAGLIVALSIPLVLAVTFLVMGQLGIDLQRISLGALIIALGLLVDDAMITVEMMVSRLEQGFDKFKAATYAYTVTAFPMLTGTLVTAAGFVPVGFAKSAAGEYTISLFQVIAVALLASWIVAVVFTPLLGVSILKPPKAAHAGHGHGKGAMSARFRRLVEACLRRRKTVIAVTLAAFALSLAGSVLVKQQFFPASDRRELLVDLTLPESATIETTSAVAARLDRILAKDRDVEHWSTHVGEGAPRFYLAMDVQPPSDNYAQAVIVAKSQAGRDRLQKKVEALLSEDPSGVLVRASPLEQGPPTGWPIKYRVSGPDLAQARAIAGQVVEVLAADPASRGLHLDANDMAKTLRVEVDQDKARAAGVSSRSLSEALQTVFTGQTVTQLRDATYLIPVIARADETERNSIETLRNLQLPTPSGDAIPLNQIANFEFALEEPMIWRRNREPTVTVLGYVTAGESAQAVVARAEKKIAALSQSLPARYKIEVGGIVEDSAHGQGSVMAAMPLMALLVVSLLMLQLQSFSRVLLVISVAPLGLIGVIPTLLAFGKPMGFIAMLGVIALAGMIIRNSLILVTQIDANIASGMTRWDSVVAATEERVRPILLTAAAAILGMIPIAGEVFWGPMAYAIMGGLVVATLLTLFFLPALYVTALKVREPGAPDETIEAGALSRPSAAFAARPWRPSRGSSAADSASDESPVDA